MGKLYFLVGMARSGKSTIANNWSRYLCNITNNQLTNNYPSIEMSSSTLNYITPRVVVCGDDIRLALHGQRFNRLAEGIIEEIKYITIRALLHRGYDILVDGTNTTLTSIKKLLYIDKTADFYIVDTPLKICIDRAVDTKQCDLVPIIHRMNKQLCEWKDNAIEVINKLRDEI